MQPLVLLGYFISARRYDPPLTAKHRSTLAGNTWAINTRSFRGGQSARCRLLTQMVSVIGVYRRNPSALRTRAALGVGSLYESRVIQDEAPVRAARSFASDVCVERSLSEDGLTVVR